MSKTVHFAATLALLVAVPSAAQDRRPDRSRAQASAAALAAAEAARLVEQTAAVALSRHAIEASAAQIVQLARQVAFDVHAVAMPAAELASLAVLEAQAVAAPAAALATQALLDAQIASRFVQDDDETSFDRALDRLRGDGPRSPWAAQDPADSLYRAARELLNRNELRSAARLFSRIRTEERFARSEYRPAAHYWEAFALSRIGGADDLRAAREILTTMRSRHPNDDRIADAAALAATIDGRLARMGDQRAARNVRSAARQNAQCGEEDDIRSAALNALLHMQSSTALPILQEILASRDECSAPLRRRAMMMLAQQHNDQARDILIDAALNDPDPEVREQATFWLSQVRGEAAVDALGRILASNPSPGVQQKAVFALGQHRSPRAGEILRDYAMRNEIPDELRRHVVFSLAQSRNAENGDFLRDMYRRSDDAEVKQMIIMSLAHHSGQDNSQWLLDIALDEREDMKVRTQALFMAGQTGRVATSRLAQLYDRSTTEEMRKQVLFVLSQRAAQDREAVDKLIEIARTAPDAETRKQAIFWLSQSRDPRVAELLLEIIRR